LLQLFTELSHTPPRKAKGKAFVGATSEATVASLVAAKALSHEARFEPPSGANSEAISLEEKALLKSAKLASNCRAKALSAQIVSPHEAKPRGEAVPASPPLRKIASKAKFRVKPKTFQPISDNIQPPRVFVLDQLGPTNTDLR